MKEFKFNIDYVPPSKWLEDYRMKSCLLQSRFDDFEKWIEKEFDKPASTYIYGGSISGAIAYSFLKIINAINVKGVLDSNYPLPYLHAIDHIIPEDFSYQLDLLFIAVSPIHFDTIMTSFINRLSPKPSICYLFNSNESWRDKKDKLVEEKETPSKELHYSSKPIRSNIIFLGDSLTNGLNSDLERLYKRTGVINQGTDGYRAIDILRNLNSVWKLSPHTFFIMIGINDLLQGSLHQDVYKTYSKIVDIIINNGSTPIIQSTLYLSQHYPSVINIKTINREVRLLNQLLKKMCDYRGLKYIDLNQKMAPKGYLQSDFTSDGIHLNTKGYGVWMNSINVIFPF